MVPEATLHFALSQTKSFCASSVGSAFCRHTLERMLTICKPYERLLVNQEALQIADMV